MAIGRSAGHASFVDAGVVGIVEELNRRATLGDPAGHVKAGPGDAALDGRAGFYSERIADASAPSFIVPVLRATVNFYLSNEAAPCL